MSEFKYNKAPFHQKSFSMIMSAMATDVQVNKAQTVIPHAFHNREYLRQALTAPRARKEEDEECRELSPLGESLAKLYVYLHNLEHGSPRNLANEAVNSIVNPKNIANRAEALGIDNCIKYNPRQKGERSLPTLRLVMNAIVGASWLDSGKDFAVSQKVVERLFISDAIQPFIDPRALLSVEVDLGNELSLVTLANSMDNLPGSIERSPALTCKDLHTTLPCFRTLTPIAEGTIGLSVANTGVISEAGNSFNTPVADLDVSTLITSPPLFQAQSPISQLPATDLVSIRQQAIRGYTTTVSVPRRSLTATQQSKKRKNSLDPLSPAYAKGLHLEQHILLEKEKCQKEKLACPLRPFDQIVHQMRQVNDNLEGKKVNELKRFFFAIASSRSLVILQSIVQTYRRSFTTPYAVAGGDLSPKERLVQIQRLTGNMAYFALLRRCHIHELVIDKSALCNQPSDGFIVSTMQTVVSLVPRKPGNPSRIDDAGISRAMMKVLHPDLESDSSEYKQKYSVVSKLRRLGQRLDLLTTKFGHGILALLPLAADVLVDSVLDIDDELILSISDMDFKSFIQHLDINIGPLLRQMSGYVDEVIVKIFKRTIDNSTSFALEHLNPDQIVEHPRGSPELLRLISKDAIYEV